MKQYKMKTIVNGIYIQQGPVSSRQDNLHVAETGGKGIFRFF
jgi:hypothetical protein